MAALNRRTVLWVAALGGVLVAASAGAERTVRLPHRSPAYRLTLESSAGGVLPTFHHEGRTFVLGEPGERYIVRIDNPTSERVEAVVSVDGRDAVTGRVANYRSQRGYVIRAYGSVRVEGFRQSLDEVAAFRFTPPGDSYSARRGTPENVGIVGIAVYRERPRTPIARAPAAGPIRRKSAAAPEARKPGATYGEASRADDGSNLGTQYGETRESSVVEVPFVRRSVEPERVITVRYDDASGLERRGIDVYRWYDAPRPRPPQAFPESRFAPPPDPY